MENAHRFKGNRNDVLVITKKSKKPCMKIRVAFQIATFHHLIKKILLRKHIFNSIY